MQAINDKTHPLFQIMLSKYLHIKRLICCTILSLGKSYGTEDDSYNSALYVQCIRAQYTVHITMYLLGRLMCLDVFSVDR